MPRSKRPAAWIACECDAIPCTCYDPPPRIGPTDRAEAERFQAEMATNAPAARAWFTDYLEQHGEELAVALARPTEDLIAEALVAVADRIREAT